MSKPMCKLLKCYESNHVSTKEISWFADFRGSVGNDEAVVPFSNIRRSCRGAIHVEAAA